MSTGHPFKDVALVAALAAPLVLAVVTVGVQLEADYVHEDLGGRGPMRALVLYHPSRHTGFADDLSLAVVEGFQAAGLATARATLTSETRDPTGYAIVAVVSNTYYWTPDHPTRRYLRRARLDGVSVLGLMAGAGATTRAARVLGEALRGAGACAVTTRSLWLLRPNDEARTDASNRAVALDLARSFAVHAAKGVTARRRH